MAQITGSISEAPDSLAARAGYDVDLYSLARVGQSEESGLGSICVMFATKNWARKKKLSITKLVTTARMKDNDGNYVVAPGDGLYGSQKHRYCATDHDPTDNMLNNAKNVISGTISDPTNGATHWDNPTLQDKRHEIDPDSNPSSEEIASRREASGMHMVIVEGVSNTRFWV